MIAEGCNSSKKNVLPLIVSYSITTDRALVHSEDSTILIINLFIYYDLFFTRYVVFCLLAIGWSYG